MEINDSPRVVSTGQLLEKKVGREEAKEVIEVIDVALQTIEKRAEV